MNAMQQQVGGILMTSVLHLMKCNPFLPFLYIQAYSNLLRANMDGLKKKDKKSKTKKSSAAQ